MSRNKPVDCIKYYKCKPCVPPKIHTTPLHHIAILLCLSNMSLYKYIYTLLPKTHYMPYTSFRCRISIHCTYRYVRWKGIENAYRSTKFKMNIHIQVYEKSLLNKIMHVMCMKSKFENCFPIRFTHPLIQYLYFKQNHDYCFICGSKLINFYRFKAPHQ